MLDLRPLTKEWTKLLATCSEVPKRTRGDANVGVASSVPQRDILSSGSTSSGPTYSTVKAETKVKTDDCSLPPSNTLTRIPCTGVHGGHVSLTASVDLCRKAKAPVASTLFETRRKIKSARRNVTRRSCRDTLRLKRCPCVGSRAPAIHQPLQDGNKVYCV